MDGEAVEAGQDLRGALEAAFKASKEPDPPAQVEPTGAVEETAEQKAQRARDEQGRFTKQEKQEKQEKQDAASVQTAQAPNKASTAKAADGKSAEVASVVPNTDSAKETGGEKQAARVPAPPNSWSPEAKARWHELPQEVLAAIAQRESEFGKTAGKMDEERALGRDVSKVFQPYMALLQAENTTPIAAVQSLLNTAYILRQGTQQQKAQAVIETCRQHGIDLSQLATPSGGPSGGKTEQVSPELAALRQEVAQLRSTFSTREQQSQSAAQAQIKQEIDAFSADPANVHYEEVKADMAALLSGGRAPDLKTAYDMACWARPDIRTSILAQQRAEEETRRREQEKQRAEEAKRKAVSVTGAPGAAVGATNGAARSLREELQANMAAARGAV